MRVMRSSGQDDLNYVLLNDAELDALNELLRKPRKKTSERARKLALAMRSAIQEIKR